MVEEERERAADLRAAIARSGLRIYRIAAACGMHPSYLSSMMHGRVPLTEAVAAKVLEHIEQVSAAQR